MAAAEEVRFSLRVTTKDSNKVLYAEIESDFANVLLSFLTLPLGTIVRLLIQHYGNDAPILGSLNSLYAGLQNMDNSHFWTEQGKLMLLKPRNSSGDQCSRLKLQIDDTPPIQYFGCQNRKCVSMYYKMTCSCSDLTNTDITKNVLVGRRNSTRFTQETTSFILTDDLEILTNSPVSILRILKRRGIQNTNVLEERTENFGLKKIMELLKTSLVSKTPISDIVFGTRSTRDKRMNFRCNFSAPTPRTGNSQNIISDSKKKITVKVLVQKSTNMVLLAQAPLDFIDFLFSFLIIPLGRVQFLLGKNPCLGRIHNFYRSVSRLEKENMLPGNKISTKLLEPQIPPSYLSKHQIFSLTQQKSPPLRREDNRTGNKIFVSRLHSNTSSEVEIIDPKGADSFVRGPAVLFVVTDDLKVLDAVSISNVSTLNERNIPLSDIEEQELVIGLEEALSILQASLLSRSALTDGFKPFLKRRFGRCWP